MTLIDIDLRVPSADGTDIPAEGTIAWTPTQRRDVADYVVLPVPFEIDAATDAQVEVDPTDSTWVWQVQERVPGGTTRFVQVPDVAGPIDYADLVDVDPATLDPEAPFGPVWAAELADHEARLDVLESAPPSTGGGTGDLTKAQADGYYAPLAFVTATNSALSARTTKTYVDNADTALSTRITSLENTRVGVVATAGDIPAGAPAGTIWLVG